jgi:phenylacetate-CoA ligase
MSTLRKLAYLQGCLAYQWLPAMVVQNSKLRALRRMLRFAEQRVPLYRESFRKAGVSARDLREQGDLRHFPLLTREQVIDAFPDGILSRPPTPADVTFRTSGSSGRFMEIAYSARAADFLDAVYARALFIAGYRPWDTIAYYWWAQQPKPLRSYERLGLMKKDFLPIHADPRLQIADLDRLRPDVIYHFPSSLLLIARALEADAQELVRTPRLVISHGEYLAAEQREYLERIFDCPVFDQYGAQEFNRMGWDCGEHRGMHEDSDSVHIEVVTERGPAPAGVDGEIVVTGLANDLMPLIRYRIGDAGMLLDQRCTCGRALPLFQLTEGRLDDVLSFDNGRRIGPRTLAPRIEDLRGFHQYRVIQKNPSSLEVLLVKDAAAEPNIEREIARVIGDVVGSEVQVNVKSVGEIPLSRRGKLRKIVREI